MTSSAQTAGMHLGGRVVCALFVGGLFSACASEIETAPEVNAGGASSSSGSTGPESAIGSQPSGAADVDANSADPSGPSTRTPAGNGTMIPGGTMTPDGRGLGAKRQGLATFYDGIGPKNCGLDDPSNRYFAAGRMDTVYLRSAACGACFRITGELGSIVLPVIDSCPITGRDVDCSVSGASLDLSPEAFEKIAPKAKGKVPVTFEPVACPVSGNLKYRFKEGSSIYWTAIQVRNHRVPVAKVEYMRGSAWVAIERVDYNYFIVQAGVGPQPSGLRLRLTSTDGQVVEETLATIGSGNVVEGRAQFK